MQRLGFALALLVVLVYPARAAEAQVTGGPGYARAATGLSIDDDFSGGTLEPRYLQSNFWLPPQGSVREVDGHLELIAGPTTLDFMVEAAIPRYFYPHESFHLEVKTAIASRSQFFASAALMLVDLASMSDSMTVVGLIHEYGALDPTRVFTDVPGDLSAQGYDVPFDDDVYHTLSVDYDAVTHTLIAAVPDLGYSRLELLPNYTAGFTITLMSRTGSYAGEEATSVVYFDDLRSDLKADPYLVSNTPLALGAIRYDDPLPGEAAVGGVVYFTTEKFLPNLQRVSVDDTWVQLEGVATYNAALVSTPAGFSTVYTALDLAAFTATFPALTVEAFVPGVFAPQGAGADYRWNLEARPMIRAVWPADPTPGTLVTLTGDDFEASGEVWLDGVPVSVAAWSPNEITIALPAALEAGMHGLEVVTPTHRSGLFTFDVLPYVAEIAPAALVPGDTFTITGLGFGLFAAGKSVVLAQSAPVMAFARAFMAMALAADAPVDATILAWQPEQIVAQVPPDAPAGLYAVTVNMNGVVSQPLGLTLGSLDPVIDTVIPSPSVPGEPITITGSNFGTTGRVFIAGYEMAVDSWSSTSITLVLPADWPPGPYDLVVETPDASSLPYSMVIGGRLDSVAPATLLPGNQFLLSGKGFGTQGALSAVLVGGYPARIVSWGDVAIIASLPNTFPGGNYDVAVSVMGFETNTLPIALRPEITRISSQGNVLSITGSGFGDLAGSVLIGATEVSARNWEGGQILVDLPPEIPAGATPVMVSANGVTSPPAQASILPSVISASPMTVAPSETLTLSGMHLGPAGSLATVYFDKTSTTGQVLVGNALAVVVPSVADGKGNVSVVINGKQSNSIGIVVDSRPTINAIEPVAVQPGGTVIIRGKSFGELAGSVYLGKSQVAATSWSNTEVSFIVPAGTPAGTVNVAVMTASKVQSKSLALTVTLAPYVTQIVPSVPRTGELITLQGLNFGATQGTSTLAIDKQVVAASSWSANAISLALSGIKDGNHSLVVKVGSVSSNSFSFTVSSKPAIESLSPKEGPTGTEVTIAGRNFRDLQGTSLLKLSDVTVEATSWSDTKIVFYIPDGTLFGRKDVYVVVGGVQSNAVSYLVGAGISALSVSTATGGDQVAVVGGGFGARQGDSYFTIGDVFATAVSWSDTLVVLVVPDATASGLQQVTPHIVDSRTRVTAGIQVVPTLKSVAPTSGTGGTNFTVYGTNFGRDTIVLVSGIEPGVARVLADQVSSIEESQCSDKYGSHVLTFGGWTHGQGECEQELGYHFLITSGLVEFNRFIVEHGLCVPASRIAAWRQVCDDIEDAIWLAVAWVYNIRIPGTGFYYSAAPGTMDGDNDFTGTQAAILSYYKVFADPFVRDHVVTILPLGLNSNQSVPFELVWGSIGGTLAQVMQNFTFQQPYNLHCQVVDPRDYRITFNLCANAYTVFGFSKAMDENLAAKGAAVNW